MRLTLNYVKNYIIIKIHTSHKCQTTFTHSNKFCVSIYQLKLSIFRKNFKNQIFNVCIAQHVGQWFCSTNHIPTCWSRIPLDQPCGWPRGSLDQHACWHTMCLVSWSSSSVHCPMVLLGQPSGWLKEPSSQQVCWLDSSRLPLIDSAWANDCLGRENHSANQVVGWWIFSASRHFSAKVEPC